MKTRTPADRDARLRDPGRRLAGERPVESEPSGHGPEAGASAPVIRARRARVNFPWGITTGRRGER